MPPALLITLCFVSLLLGACKSQETVPSPAVVAELPPAPPLDSILDKVKSGETYAKIIENLELNEKETALLRNSVFAHFDGRLYAGQEYRAVLRGEGAERVVERFQMRSRHEPVRSVLRREETVTEGTATAGFVFAKEEVPLRVDTVSMSATLNTSLYEAFQEVGEGPQLVHKVTELFAWDIDFFRDPRQGDGFQLLVEKKYDDLNRFIGYGRILSAQYKSSKHAFTGVFYQDAYYNFEGKSMEKMLLKAPLNYARISSGFSRSRLHPVLGVRRPHWGVDYAAPTGTRILAAGDGVVVYAKWVGGYGKTIKIRHNNIYTTYYAHLNGYAKNLRAGSRVKQGEVIGYLGSTGLSTGPHLDYRVEVHGKYVDPTGLTFDAKESIAKEEWEYFQAHRDRLMALMQTEDTPPGNRMAAQSSAPENIN